MFYTGNWVPDFVTCPTVNPLARVHDLCWWERVHNLGSTVRNEAQQLPLLLRRIGCQMSDKVFLEVQMVATTAWN